MKFNENAGCDPYEYKEEPPVSYYAMMLTTVPLREMFQSRDRADIELLVKGFNDAADEQGSYDHRAVAEEYRRVTPQFAQMLKAVPVMLAALLAGLAGLRRLVLENAGENFDANSLMQQMQAAIDDALDTPLTGLELESDSRRRRLSPNKDLMAQAETEHLPLRWLYLSFAGVEDGFRGAIIVEAHGIHDAIAKTWALGINPGGNAVMADISGMDLPPEEFRNRLLSLTELRSIWPDVASLRDRVEQNHSVADVSPFDLVGDD